MSGSQRVEVEAMPPGGVIVVGAGPVGLTAAALLAREGVPCLVLEKRDGLSRMSRASTFHPPTLEIFRELGIVDAMLSKGLIADRIQYRMNSGEVVAEFDHALLAGELAFPFRLHLEQSAVTPLLCDAIAATGRGRVEFGADVVAADSDESAAWVDVRALDGRVRRIRADYVLGADGAHSSVRRSLGIGLAGEDYPGKVLRLVVNNALADYLPGIAQVSYIFSEDGRSISLLQMADCWRIIIRLPASFEENEVVKPEWYMPVVKRFIPAAPDVLDLRSLDIYGASKMVADAYGRGRVFLIGDATHLTNTRGGMNMNCGIHDAYEMALALLGSLQANDPNAVLEAALRRRRVAVNELIPRTDRNVTGGGDLLAQMRATGQDREASRQLLRRSAMLDMAPARRGMRSAVQEAVE